MMEKWGFIATIYGGCKPFHCTNAEIYYYDEDDVDE